MDDGYPIRTVVIGGRSDLYALGCVVHEMVSGRTPFEGTTPQGLLAKHARDAYVPPWEIATLYCLAGADDRALYWLERGVSERDPNMPYLSVFPLFDGIHDAPRFQDLLRRMNLPPG